MNKKATQKPKEVPKDIQDLEEFQAQYGEQFQKITQMPAFRAGLQLLNVRALDEITSLSNEDIEKYAPMILANLIGMLKHENNIFNLHKEQSFRVPIGDDDVVYMSPEEEAAHQQLREKFSEETTRKRYG
jgi:hypothetical protein